MLARPLVIMLGLGKSGTQTTHDFFKCAGWSSSHWVCQKPGQRDEFCATCVLRWIAKTMPLASWNDERRHDYSAELQEECGNYTVFAQIDVATSHTCAIPQVSFLHMLLARLPNACFVMTYRSEASWVESMARWGTLKPRTLKSCPLLPKNDSGLAAYYAAHKARVRAALAASDVCNVQIDLETESLTDHLNTCFNVNAPKRCLAIHKNKTPKSRQMRADAGNSTPTSHTALQANAASQHRHRSVPEGGGQ